jgi:hypothetical protein
VATLAGLALFYLLSNRMLPATRLRSAPATGHDPTLPGRLDAAALPAPTDAEAAIPRWRRPSLLEARSGGGWGTRSTRESLVFDTPPAPDVERCRVAYRLVRLSSMADEVLGEEIGRLDRGDEVDVLAHEGGFCWVRTPSGAEGWVPGLTLTGWTAQEGTP